MAFNFPASPTVGQSYPAPPVPGLPTYTWDGEKWMGATAGPANAPPLMDGVAAVGVSVLYTRQDHIHPSDTSRVVKAGDTMTGHLTLPTGPAAANAVRKDYVDAGVAAATAVANAKLPLSGGTMSGQIATAGGSTLTDAAVSPALVVVNSPGVPHACMTFLANGYFGCQFGIANDGNFYYGGISLGASAYRFWTTRDFTSAPVGGAVTNGRLAIAGDFLPTLDGTFHEPYPGAMICDVATNAGRVVVAFRWRYMQLFNGGWFTCGYA